MDFKATRLQMRTVRLLYTEPTTKTKLANKLKVERTTIHYILAKFEDKGMLNFSPNLQDMRGELVTLSENFIKKLTHTPIMQTI